MAIEYLVTAQEMKRYDYHTIHSLKIPGTVLMERAALKTVEVICSQFPRQSGLLSKKILVVAGGGNNGGDGLAIARLLVDLGCRVETVFLGDPQRVPQETSVQLDILANYGMSLGSIFPEGEYDIIVDALFGIGLSREVTGIYRDAICRMNASNAWKISVDVPSGIDADTGKVWGVAVQAHMTVTFGYQKRGLLFYPGAQYAGQVICVDIGINEKAFDGQPPVMYTLTGAAKEHLLKRRPDGNKGTFGKVFLYAGSEQMAGAAILCSKSTLRAGAGMVKICTTESNRVILQETLPEAMLLCYETVDDSFREKIREGLRWADCVVAGPGIGTTEKAREILDWLLEDADIPMVLDADALNLLSSHKQLQKTLLGRTEQQGDVVLTPHAGELARLLSCTIQEIKEKPEAMARQAAAEYQAVIASKDARTLVCAEEGPIFMNTSGNSGMATAGSGDVLSGIIGALCAGGMDVFTGACAGVYLHACAGDLAAEEKSRAGLMASDLIDAVTILQRG